MRLAMEVTSGRYISARHSCIDLGEELKLLAVNKVYLLGGHRALALVLPRIEPALKAARISYQVAVFEGYCTYETAHFHAEKLRAKNCDCIVGIGGGRCIDTAKAAAEFANCILGTIPTQAATCVCCTNMAIMYAVNGRYLGPLYPRKSIAFTLVDYDILSTAPVRYIASGIVDALAKYPELRFSQRGTCDCKQVDDAALQASYAMSTSTWDILMANGQSAYTSNAAGVVDSAFTSVINTNLVTTGIISGLARGNKQLAMAHAVYNYSTIVFPKAWREYLHGEIVSVGIVLQEYYNQAPAREIEQYIQMAKALHVPVCLQDIGVAGTTEDLDQLHSALMQKFTEFSDEEAKRLREAMDCIVKL